MDEKVETLASSDDVIREPGSTDPATAARSLDLNELQEFSEKKLKALARDLDLFLHPARAIWICFCIPPGRVISTSSTLSVPR